VFNAFVGMLRSQDDEANLPHGGVVTVSTCPVAGGNTLSLI
jgi:hypothetical protein